VGGLARLEDLDPAAAMARYLELRGDAPGPLTAGGVAASAGAFTSAPLKRSIRTASLEGRRSSLSA